VYGLTRESLPIVVTCTFYTLDYTTMVVYIVQSSGEGERKNDALTHYT
jgi:hypothetical protein